MLITEKQRKYIFVLLQQYTAMYKFTTEEAKEILKIAFCQLKEKKYFSLSINKPNACTSKIASEFIDFIKKEIES